MVKKRRSVVGIFIIVGINFVLFYSFNQAIRNAVKPFFYHYYSNQLKPWVYTVVPTSEKPFVIVVTSFNNAAWVTKNLDSITQQQYHHYRIIYVDDASVDGTAAAVKAYAHTHAIDDKLTLIENRNWQGLMANHYRAAWLCKDHEIIVHLDGDDWFAHPHVLELLNKVYSSDDVWLTYGQYQEWPRSIKGACKPILKHYIARNKFREQLYIYSALRTFYAWLFKAIKIADLMTDGTFLLTIGDINFMYAMVELTGTHNRFIPDVLYIYNKTPRPARDSIFNIARTDIEHLPKQQPLTAPQYHTSSSVHVTIINVMNRVEEDLIAYLHSLSTSYCLLTTTSIPPTQPVLAACIEKLEQTGAYGFYYGIRLAHLPDWQASYTPTFTGPRITHRYAWVGDSWYAFQFKYGPAWHNELIQKPTLYKTKDLIKVAKKNKLNNLALLPDIMIKETNSLTVGLLSN
jgi:hypothetical protein